MEAHADIVIHNNRVVIDVVHHGDIHIIHRAVVVEVAGVPVTALVPGTRVSVTVVHAAIEANVRPPVAAEESIVVVNIAPVAGRPERTLIRSLNPDARHPVVSIRGVVPVPGRPQVPITGILRLVVFRQRWRRVRSVGYRLLAVVRVVIIRRLVRSLLIIGIRIGRRSALLVVV
jgi:hypothetical protein